MEIVNKYFLDDLVSPLAGGADFDEFQYLQHVDPNDSVEVKELIRKYIFPYFEEKGKNYKTKCKLSLAYYLNQNKIDFERLLESNLLPIRTPSNPINFFIWVWEVFFSGEDFSVLSKDKYDEKNDQYEPIRLSMKREN